MAGKIAASHGRRTWAVPTGLLIGYCALCAATAIAIAADGTHRPGFALALLAVTAFAVASRATVPTAFGVGAMSWLFYDGFIIGRHAALAWHGVSDVQRVAVLAGSAITGAGISWLAARIDAVHRARTLANQAHTSQVRPPAWLRIHRAGVRTDGIPRPASIARNHPASINPARSRGD